MFYYIVTRQENFNILILFSTKMYAKRICFNSGACVKVYKQCPGHHLEFTHRNLAHTSFIAGVCKNSLLNLTTIIRFLCIIFRQKHNWLFFSLKKHWLFDNIVFLNLPVYQSITLYKVFLISLFLTCLLYCYYVIKWIKVFLQYH